jgi:DNA-binding SARP family transcriptional activator
MYEIQLFGQLEVRTRGVRLAGRDFGGVKPRHILALLALRGALSKDDLADLLWDSRPKAFHTTLESYVSVLRRRLDPETPVRHSVIITRNGGYALDDDRVRTDVARFDELVSVAVGRTPSRALPPLTAAVHLASRPLMDDGTGALWAAQARELYRTRLAAALLDAGDHALATGQARLALDLSARALADDPYAERAWYVSMAAYRLLGDRVSALRAYDRCRRQLCEGLGVEPSPPVQALFLELLRQGSVGSGVDGAVAAVLAAARELSHDGDALGGWGGGGSALQLLRRAAELTG